MDIQMTPVEKMFYDKDYIDGHRDASGWISVNDRLPERDGRYLVTTKLYANCNYIDTAFFNEKGKHEMEGKTNVFFDIDDEWGDYEKRVTHWMPLPEPTKEEA